MDSAFQDELMRRLDGLEKKLDNVRTIDLPKVKTDVAVLISENKANSKLHSVVGSIVAVVISSLMPHR